MINWVSQQVLCIILIAVYIVLSCTDCYSIKKILHLFFVQRINTFFSMESVEIATYCIKTSYASKCNRIR